jgi:hypothetical protein
MEERTFPPHFSGFRELGCCVESEQRDNDLLSCYNHAENECKLIF